MEKFDVFSQWNSVEYKTGTDRHFARSLKNVQKIHASHASADH